MSKKFIKVFSTLLVAVMVMTVVPLNRFFGLDLNLDWFDFNPRASALSSLGLCGDNVTFIFDKPTGLLTISGNGAMYDYYDDNSPFYQNLSIKRIVVNDGVTSIGTNAFSDCTELTSIIISDSVKNIGFSAFNDCTGLKEITVPCSKSISNAFFGCTNIEKITLSKGTGVIEGTYVYLPWYISRNNIKEIVLEDGITNISGAVFHNCTGLISITIPDSVTNIGIAAFSGCTGLTSITIPDSVTGIGEYAFSGCTRLKNITISDSVTNIDNGVFMDCAGLTSIILPNSITSIDDFAFYGCSELTSMTIPDRVTDIGECAFCHCTGLASITIPDSVINIDINAFYGCSGLTNINFTGTQEQWYKIIFEDGNGALANAAKHFDCLIVKSVSIGNDFSLNYNGTAKLNPVIEADSGVKYTVEYKSSNPKVATVDNNGNVKGVKAWGTKSATITCTVTDQYGNVVTDTCKVTCGYTWWQWIIGIVLFGWIWY